MEIVSYYKSDNSQISEDFIKIVFYAGVVFGITLVIDFVGVSYMKYLLNSEDGGYWKYIGFLDSFKTVFQIEYYIARLSYLIFFIGLMPLLLKRGKYTILAIIFLLTTIHSIFNYFFPNVLNLQFTPENYKVSSLIYQLVLVSIIFIGYLLIYLTSKDKFSKIAGRLMIIAGFIDIVDIIAYAIMFSIDSSYFTDRFSSIVEIFRIYYTYLSAPIYIIAVGLLIYQIKLKLNSIYELN